MAILKNYSVEVESRYQAARAQGYVDGLNSIECCWDRAFEVCDGEECFDAYRKGHADGERSRLQPEEPRLERA